MAQRIVGHHSMEVHAPSAEDLRRVFNSAVGEIHHANRAVKDTLRYGCPIFQRRSASVASQEGTEKRAVSDAARALAQLWKISGSPAR